MFSGRSGWGWGLGVWLCATGASAQSTDTFRGAQPFPGTVRDLLRDDLAKTSSQLYGAIGTLERRGVLHMKPNTIVAVAETNIIGGALRIPGTSAYGPVGDSSYRGQYQLLPADVFAFSAVFAWRGENLGLFASAGAVYPRVSDGTEAAVGRTIFPLVGVLATPLAHLGVGAAPFFTGDTKLIGSQKSADTFSYLYGAFYEVQGAVLYAGLVGTGRGSGLYTNISQNRLKLLAESVLGDGFSELSYLKVGTQQLPNLADLFASGSSETEEEVIEEDEGNEEGEPPKKKKKKKRKTSRARRPSEDDPPRTVTSFYGRKVLFSIPRRGADNVAFEPAKLGFWSVHAEHAFERFHTALAAGIRPSPVLHEARIGVHSRGYFSENAPGVGLSVGAVQLPALYALGQQPGFRLAFRAEVRLGEVLRAALYRNEPETLAAFPYAYDAWAFYFSASPLLFFQRQR